jgi:lysophospholipase L1-like esterase
MKRNIICALCAILLASFNASQSKTVRIFMAGASTMATQPAYKTAVDSLTGKRIEEPFLMMGWGQLLPEFFTKDVVVINKALSGRSTRSFRAEGHWDKLISQVGENDYVIIHFGHNDESPQKTGRYSSPEDYGKNLERFVDEVRDKGAVPILCTPIVRRKFDKEGKLVNTHGVYPDVVRQVAKEQNVLLVDMESASRKLVEEYGVEKSKELYLHIQPGVNKLYPEGKKDNTHFGEKGARIMAQLFVDGIKSLDIRDLTAHLLERIEF